MEFTGWLLDVYADPHDGVALWLLDEHDGSRRRLRQALPVAFHAAGPALRLRQLWRYLGPAQSAAQGPAQQPAVTLSRSERRELFSDQPVSVLTVQVSQPAAQPALFRRVSRAFPDLTYYDADLSPALHHAARYGTFPLARCHVDADEQGQVQSLEVLDTPWDLDPCTPPLRVLSLEPDVDPFHAPPSYILARTGRACYRLALSAPRPLLVNLRAILMRHDPDLLLTTWGDTWLLPYLLELSEHSGLSSRQALRLPWRAAQGGGLPLNRDPAFRPLYRPERTYFAYGQVIYRGQQVHLFGRWHVDGHNAVLYHDYGMEGILELARVTSLPVQAAARLSPGSGISTMQMLTALREGVLVPWHKQQAEQPKTARELLRADQGGLVYQPVVGLHKDVAEIDFVSMYPSIMARFNISPETVKKEPHLSVLPDSGEGLVPKTLQPLLDKRIALKLRLAELPAPGLPSSAGWHPRRNAYKARASAHKWLLVTCFGYLGYKNARFGRIEAHEAVTAYGREMLLRAKEAAEDLGYTVLHLYVDGMWVQKEGANKVVDFQPVLDEIAERTSLPVALDGIYRWVAFLPSRACPARPAPPPGKPFRAGWPSPDLGRAGLGRDGLARGGLPRVDARIPVPNRYFGVFQDGSLKMRGIEARRQDTPPWIAQVQLAMLNCLAQARSVDELMDCTPAIEQMLRKACTDLRLGRVPLAGLLVSQKLSRELNEYRVPSPAARAAAQLEAVGKHLRPGQRVRFLYTLGEPACTLASPAGRAGVQPRGVRAWDLPEPPNQKTIDWRYYRKLLMRAAETVLQPLGMDISIP